MVLSGLESQPAGIGPGRLAEGGSSGHGPLADSSHCGVIGRRDAPGSDNVTKRKSESIEQIVEELIGSDLTKAERIKRLRALAHSDEDVPDELMDQALRRLMERITD